MKISMILMLAGLGIILSTLPALVFGIVRAHKMRFATTSAAFRRDHKLLARRLRWINWISNVGGAFVTAGFVAMFFHA